MTLLTYNKQGTNVGIQVHPGLILVDVSTSSDSRTVLLVRHMTNSLYFVGVARCATYLPRRPTDLHLLILLVGLLHLPVW
jgi:hypothetical protein